MPCAWPRAEVTSGMGMRAGYDATASTDGNGVTSVRFAGAALMLGIVLVAAWMAMGPAGARASTELPPPCQPSSVSSSTLFAFAGPRGLRPLSDTEIPVCVSGHLLAQFHGDRATSCAAHGLCAYAGKEFLLAGAGARLDLLAYSFRGRRGYDTALSLDGDLPLHAEVTRSVRSGSGPVCRDSSSGPPGFLSPDVAHGTLRSA